LTGIISCIDLNWHRRGEAFTLHLHRSTKPLLTVEPDATYPGMWRVRHQGRLSDMTNISRAKDAACTVALADLNDLDRQETASEGSPVRLDDAEVPVPIS
jgi:hypothetical protein